MLQRLKITNIALIKNLCIEFNSGLNILSGETGAGKSIIIDSINFLLGNRADKSLIRNNESTAKVEGVFDVNKNSLTYEILNSYGIECEDTLIISRLMSREGKSDIRVNGDSVTVSMLKEISSSLVDIYGQNEQQFLLKNKNQLLMLDKYVGKNDLLEDYKQKLTEYNSIKKELSALGGNEEERNKEIDFLNFQINEIMEANLEENEEEEISEQLKKMNNIEKITSSLNIIQDLFENSQGINSSINNAIRELNFLSNIDKNLDKLNERLVSCKYELEDISFEIKDYLNSLEYDPEEFYRLDSRMDLIKKLKRKYGRTIKDILSYQNELQERLDDLVNAKDKIDILEQNKNKILDEIFVIGTKLSKLRRENAKKLEKSIMLELQDLNMQKTRFEIEFLGVLDRENIEKSLHTNGLEEIEFLFSANLGQPLLPLNKIISGGEMSRFMLALKSVLANCDDMPTMIFDEIDTGISGKTSTEVAKKMANISKYHQVLAVTHSFQVVAMADNNIYVSKTQQNEETTTNVENLTEDKIIENLSQMLGMETSSTSKLQAKELREWSIEYKNRI